MAGLRRQAGWASPCAPGFSSSWLPTVNMRSHLHRRQATAIRWTRTWPVLAKLPSSLEAAAAIVCQRPAASQCKGGRVEGGECSASVGHQPATISNGRRPGGLQAAGASFPFPVPTPPCFNHLFCATPILRAPALQRQAAVGLGCMQAGQLALCLGAAVLGAISIGTEGGRVAENAACWAWRESPALEIHPLRLPPTLIWNFSRCTCAPPPLEPLPSDHA